jgi:rhodanese-related sulfurtransferase
MPQSVAAAADQSAPCSETRSACSGSRCTSAHSVGRLFGRALIITAVAGLIAVADSARRPFQLSLNPNTLTPAPLPAPTPAPSTEPAPIQSDPAAAPLDVRITLAQAKGLYDSLAADFIDAREPHEFAPGHIPGAYNLTQSHFAGSKTPEALEILDPSRPVVIYCGGGDCHASENVAILLQQAGFTSIHIMIDGFPAWVAAGYESEAAADDSPEGGGS